MKKNQFPKSQPNFWLMLGLFVASSLNFYACNQNSSKDEIKPDFKVRNKNTGYTAIQIPTYATSTINIVDTTFTTQFMIQSPNNNSQQRAVRAVIQADSVGKFVSVKLEDSFLSDTGVGTGFWLVDSSCSERNTCRYGICLGNCGRLPNVGDQRRDCRISCLQSSLAVSLYDATWGWVSGCYYPSEYPCP